MVEKQGLVFLFPRLKAISLAPLFTKESSIKRLMAFKSTGGDGWGAAVS